MVVDLFITLQRPAQRIHCLHLQRLAKFHQMLMKLYYPFEFHILTRSLRKGFQKQVFYAFK